MRDALIVVLVLAVAACALIGQRSQAGGRLPRDRERHLRIRLHLRLRPGRGHATGWHLWWKFGRFASFRHSGQTRPGLTRWQRWCHPDEHSVFIGRAHHFRGIRLPVDQQEIIDAPPRAGKTQLVARKIMYFPGAVLSTSTRADVFELTSGLRARRGPVAVFNPEGIGGIPSTFAWDPVDGAEAPAVAIRRADGFATAIKVEGENAFFADRARSYLRTLLHAAALTGADMRTVARWALTATSGGAVDAENILRAHGAGSWADELAQLRGPADRTNATNEMMLSQALAFAQDPALAAAVLPGPGGIDLAGLITRCGTLYMIASSYHDEAPLAPLFAAMASEMHWQASRIGQASPTGRLDPPLLLALDEVTQICPVPVPSWLADSAGKGIQVVVVAHGEAQLRSRWGEHGARVIMDTAGAKIVLPGVSDPDTLEMLSRLCGQAAYREHGQEHHTRHDVLTPSMLNQLPDGFALVKWGNSRPVIVKAAQARTDRAYRRARRQGWAVADLPALAAAAVLSGGVPSLDGAALPRLPPAAGLDNTGNGSPNGLGPYPWAGGDGR